ncbi:MAG: diaminopimelate epimerase [Termitinemataceae bacterium]|nr:MAG: diaminopimelate epimerase [Termitinemataceae bacterium]
MNIDIIIADPCGNITAFVPAKKIPFTNIETAKKILADKTMNVEQVGFFTMPTETADSNLWHLEMMGGEFCGNAARSFGLFCAKKRKLTGKNSIPVSISGTQLPVIVNVDVEENFAEVEIPPHLKIDQLLHKLNPHESKILPVCVFDGITHVIAKNISANKKNFFDIKKIAESAMSTETSKSGNNKTNALGIMFFDSQNQFLQPAVYVYKTESLVFESSCASGSAAFAICKYKDITDCNEIFLLKEPGGIIQVGIKKTADKIDSITIGGKISFRYLQYFSDT